MLDALVYFLGYEQFDLSYRRTFNQQKVFCESIMIELRDTSPDLFVELIEKRSEEGNCSG